MVMLASDYDKSKYLKAEDLKGQEKKYRIKDITEEVFENNNKSEKKPVLWFTRGDQGLVLGAKTNLRTLSGAWGDVMNDWKNKIVILFPVMTEVRGQMKAAIRVRISPPKLPQQSAAQSAPTPKDDGTTSPAPSQSSGNGAAASPTPSQSSGNGTAVAATVAAAAVPAAVVDPELEPDPVKTHDEEMDDEIPF